ncbi:MAG: hypothetical protein AAGD92_02090 [Pseudomonadota bacterium]
MSNAAPYWIQSADLSTEEFPAAGASEIERALLSHDWAGEAEKEKRLLADDSPDCCPAGLGVVHEDGRMLHVCPDGEGNCQVHYSFYESAKVLGFIPRRKYNAGTIDNVPIRTAARLIPPFLENSYEAIKYEVEAFA